MSLLGFLPITAFAAAFLALFQVDRDEGAAFVRAALGWGAYAVLLSEGLSLFHAVAMWSLTVAWLMPTVVAVGLLVRTRKRQGRLALPPVPIPHGSFLRLVALSVAVLVFLTGVIAWFAPPNTWDALTYHMSRVAHWAQNGTIGHYATGNEVQNLMPPAAAIFHLQFYVLGNGDRLVNFVQWFAMVGCLVVVARIASRFGAGERGRWFAVAFVATLPAGIMQATAVMTDYVVALWVVIAALEIVELWQGRGGPEAVISLGLAAGLAIETKQTALAYLAPFAAILIVIAWRRPDRPRFLALGVAGLLILSLFNVGYLTRNLATYGNTSGPSRRLESQVNQILDGRVLVSNILRNAALNAGTPSPHINKATTLVLLWVHDRLGLDVNDPRTTTAEGEFRIKPPQLHETVAGNVAHAVLLLALVPLGWLVRRRLPGLVGTYAGLVVLTFVLLSAIFQWKITGARYQVGFFVLMAPVVGAVLEALPWGVVGGVVTALLLIFSVPWVVGNHSRPLVSGWPGADVASVLSTPREDLYFANAPYLITPYREMVEVLRQSGCPRIALALPGGGLEYPFWALLGSPRQDLEIEWLVAGTASARYNEPDFAPCAVVCERCPDSWVTVRGLPELFHSGSFRIYLDPASSRPADASPATSYVPRAAYPGVPNHGDDG